MFSFLIRGSTRLGGVAVVGAQLVVVDTGAGGATFSCSCE